MQTYDERIAPGSALKITITGSIFYIKSSSAGEVLTVEFVNGSAQGAKVQGVGKGFKASPASRFDGVRITASVETQVEFIISDGEIEFAFNTDEIIIGNDDSKALPVRVPPGESLQVRFDNDINIGVVQVENNLVVIVDAVAVPVGTVATSVSNDPTLKKIRMRNMSEDATIAIGGAGVALGSPILLAPGEMYFEDDAAGAHLYAIADGVGALLVIQGLK
jgi:hypothetical protein